MYLPVFHQKAMPEQAHNWVPFGTPAQIIACRNKNKPTRLRPHHENWLEARKHYAKYITQLSMENLHGGKNVSLANYCLQGLQTNLGIRGWYL
jgi:hypothetical protein